MSSAGVAVRGLALGVGVALAGCSGGSTANTAPPTASAAPPPAQAPAQSPEPAPSAPTSNSAEKEWVRPPAISDADIPPPPLVPFAPARPMEIVRAVYVFAAKHPEVLSKVPCFCGCESRGHRHNDDCFVTARDAQGRPTVWEPHGVG
jgi:hypothetical protein